MALIYTRGRALKTAITGLFVVVAAASLLTVLVQLVFAASGGPPLDPGWGVIAGVSTAVAIWTTRSQWLLRLLSVADPWAHQSRTRAVWGLLALVVLLVVGLKTGSPDRDAYKNLVFGEGGLVEWSQVLVLVLATRAAWLIGADLNARLQERRPGRLFQCGAACLALVLMEELAWGQVIFSWRTPPLLNEINAQHETTLHNIGWLQDRLDVGTFLATLGVLAVVVLAPRWMRVLTTNWSESMAAVTRALTPAFYSWPLFMAVSALAFCIATRTFSDLILNRDQEWGELVLYASLLLLLLRTRVLLGAVEPQAPDCDVEDP
ncbi:hypothetical protein [Synechococcus sp. MU1642]|uniref:hypothetical protein n=1 Tax=Synechococcus sp. MU1642 TaxID=2508348 RepID=UPI001CF879AE|nr:hypothetical protein [Synechococcus sp. MU1642]MCB4408180.1 hypothetical protein [Synechococcus sp. MU1642]